MPQAMSPIIFIWSFLSLLVAPTSALTINVVAAFQCCGNSPWSFPSIGAGVSMAIEDFQNSGRLANHTFRIIPRTVTCNPGINMKVLAKLYYSTEKPDVLFGMSCSVVMIPLDRYLSYWNIAHFPHGGTNPKLSNKDVYSTLVRIHPSGDKMGIAFTNMFRKYGWQRAAMVTSYGFCELTALGINPALKELGVTITEWIQPPQKGSEDYELEQYLDQVKERARVIIICFDVKEALLRFLKIAHRKGMTSPDYVILTAANIIEPRTLEPWINDPNLNAQSKEEWKKILVELNYKQVVLSGLKGQKYEDFYDLHPVKLSQPPWNYNESLEVGRRGSYKSVDLYDATLTYLTILEEILAEGREDYNNGELINHKARNRVINGMRGKILYDHKADREPDFWVFDLQPGWDKYREVVTIVVAEEEGKRFVPIDDQSVYWGTVGNLPPPDTPLCGFQNELCDDDTSGNNLLVIGFSAGGALFLIVIILVIVMYRRQKEQEALQQTVWKVDFLEVRIGKARVGSVANMSQRSLRDDSASLHSGNEEGGIRQLFTEVGAYRGNLVAILRVDKPRVELTKADMKELKMMKDMSHTNLAIFVGACIDPPNICYIMDYYAKGSIQDIIENEVIGLDWMFKTSLLSDLANGMAYLHKSELQSHGSLKSTCCLVDSRWQLKVSSYGLHAFRTDQKRTDVGEHGKYRKMLWTAPELLRMPNYDRPRYGTQAGDVYSFGVIAQEVIYRAPPFFLELESPKDFISKLTKVGQEQPKPKLPKLEDDTPAEAVELVEVCWVNDPSNRPTFEKIIKKIQTVNKNNKVDIMDSLVEKLEKYANNLEDIVNQRTSELVVEKKRTDKLLESMLPKSVVEELKHGRTVNAELFDAVTIFFSDIVGFTALSLESSPIDVVNLLNDLYTLFDDIISLHDVYKMETIGDSYMVVSGLPHRNGDNHVGEIANLALDLMSATLDFKIRHRPGLHLQLRIGFHTGPCAAGVVGLSMPRYCLFGDTVNMASRMETNGKALMIHMSKYAFAALDNFGGYQIRPRGEMQIKGKGLQMTYWLLGKDGFNKPLPPFDD